MTLLLNKDLQKLVTACLLDQAWTPDALALNSQVASTAVFVYGTEKGGYTEDLTAAGAQRIGIGYTSNGSLLMYQHTTEHYPVVLIGPNHEGKGRIQGHVFRVTPEQLFELDQKYQNQAYFKRAPAWVQYKFPTAMTSPVWHHAKMWMYVGMNAAWTDKIKNKTIVLQPRISSHSFNLGPYYIFNKNDEHAIIPPM